MAGNTGYAVELLLIEEQLTALERSAERLRAMNDDAPSAEIEMRINEVVDRAAPLERRRQELLADFDTSASVTIAPQETQPPLTEIQVKVDAIRKRQKSRQQAADNLNKDIQPELDFLNGIERTDEYAAQDQKLERERSKLLPARYTNRDFFVADIFGYSLKDDAATMEAPVFSLKTQKDFSVWEWTSKDGSRHIEVSPSVKYGRATMHDKSVLIFVTSQMTEALNRERPDAQNRAVRFTVHNYLVATNKPTGGAEYERLETTLDRLKGVVTT